MEYLLWSTGQAVLNLVNFSDRKVSEGTLKQRRFILPGNRRLRKWFMGLFKQEDSGTEHSPDSAEAGSTGVHAGKSYEAAKDPEHLPPTNAWQRFSTGLRSIGEFLGSPESGFGFRAACATMSIGIIVFLRDTQTFFLDQRLVWAMIMVSIGMTMTAGSGIFGFLGRIAGTSEFAHINNFTSCLMLDSICHVFKLRYLVYCRWQNPRRHCFLLYFHVLRNHHPYQISAPRNNRHYFNCHSNTHYRLRT